MNTVGLLYYYLVFQNHILILRILISRVKLNAVDTFLNIINIPHMSMVKIHQSSPHSTVNGPLSVYSSLLGCIPPVYSSDLIVVYDNGGCDIITTFTTHHVIMIENIWQSPQLGYDWPLVEWTNTIYYS